MAKKIKINGTFFPLLHSVFDSEDWQAASMAAREVTIAIARLHNGRNNGDIPYSQREAQKYLHCGASVAVAAFREAQERGFIEATRKGSFTVKTGRRMARVTTWRVTFLQSKTEREDT